MKAFHPSKRELVEIEFLDHCQHSGDKPKALLCTVLGILVGEDKDAYVVANWRSEGEIDTNMESYVILKKVITGITPLYRGKRRAKNKKASQQK